ncbi:MAG: hypothetical protein EOO89_30280 [Pedobacter sp.]|nr:MAG: hypothetical protein EOO89_30280 [Pedobacter sp.]
MQQQGCLFWGTTIYPNYSHTTTVNSDQIDYYKNSNPLQVCFWDGQANCTVLQSSISGVGRNCIVNGMYGRVVNYSVVQVPLDTSLSGAFLMSALILVSFFRLKKAG